MVPMAVSPYCQPREGRRALRHTTKDQLISQKTSESALRKETERGREQDARATSPSNLARVTKYGCFAEISTSSRTRSSRWDGGIKFRFSGEKTPSRGRPEEAPKRCRSKVRRSSARRGESVPLDRSQRDLENGRTVDAAPSQEAARRDFEDLYRSR